MELNKASFNTRAVALPDNQTALPNCRKGEVGGNDQNDSTHKCIRAIDGEGNSQNQERAHDFKDTGEGSCNPPLNLHPGRGPPPRNFLPPLQQPPSRSGFAGGTRKHGLFQMVWAARNLREELNRGSGRIGNLRGDRRAFVRQSLWTGWLEHPKAPSQIQHLQFTHPQRCFRNLRPVCNLRQPIPQLLNLA